MWEPEEDGDEFASLDFIKVTDLENNKIRISTDYIVRYFQPKSPTDPEHMCTIFLSDGHIVCIKDSVTEVDTILGLNWS